MRPSEQDHPRRQTTLAPLILSTLACALAPPAFAGDGVGLFVERTNFTLLKPQGAPKFSFHFGFSNSYDRATQMMPFTHDWDDDGDDSLGYYNRREGRFYFAERNEGRVIEHEIDFAPPLAPSGPVWPIVLNNPTGPGVEVGVYEINHNKFHFQTLGTFTWGSTQSIPIAGDWNGDGVETIGLYSLSGESFALNDNIPPSGTSHYIPFGAPNSIPFAGDWNGDGVDQVGYYDPRIQKFHRHIWNNVKFTEPYLDNFQAFKFVYPDGGGTTPIGIIVDSFPLAGNWDEQGSVEQPPFDWEMAGPGQHPFDVTALNDLVTQIITQEDLQHVNSLLVAYDGRMVLEEYFHGWEEQHSHHMMSATKSVLSALVGVAITDGVLSGPFLSLRNPFETVNPVYAICGGNTIRLWDAMSMSSGFTQNNNTWENPGPGIPGHFVYTDWIEWILNGPVQPGCDPNWWNSNNVGKFAYFGGNNHAVAEFLRRKLLAEPYTGVYDFAVQRLFTRLGIEPTRWDHEPSSNALPQAIGAKVFYGESQMFMRPRDMARFGQLFVEGGTIVGEGGAVDQLLTQQWVDVSTSDVNVESGQQTLYGFWWWRQHYGGNAMCFKGHYGFEARGYGGQHIVVFPTLELVIVIASDWMVPDAQSSTQMSRNEGLTTSVLQAMTGVTGSCSGGD